MTPGIPEYRDPIPRRCPLPTFLAMSNISAEALRLSS